MVWGFFWDGFFLSIINDVDDEEDIEDDDEDDEYSLNNRLVILVVQHV
jgi:hypothetical protein